MRIHAEDLLVRVDGVDIAGKEAHAIEKLIMGPFGSPVSLTLESAKNMERISVRLTRKEPVSGHFVVQAQVSCLLPNSARPYLLLLSRHAPFESLLRGLHICMRVQIRIFH
jgi:hypothetical protein